MTWSTESGLCIQQYVNRNALFSVFMLHLQTNLCTVLIFVANFAEQTEAGQLEYYLESKHTVFVVK